MKLAAYTRVSVTRQATDGAGLDVQRDAITAWAKADGHKVTLWTTDAGISGTKGLDHRLGLLEALDAVQRGLVGGVVVYRLDRLSRDTVLSEQLLAEVWRTGGRVFSTSPAEDAYLDPEGADLDPSRKMIRVILASVAEYERSMIRLRLNASKARKAAVGGYLGGLTPFGFVCRNGDLVPDESEQATVARMRELHDGGHSLRSICAVLGQEGHRPKRSDRWHPNTVSAVLKRLV